MRVGPTGGLRRPGAPGRADRRSRSCPSSASSRRRCIHRASVPAGLRWPADPQWGNFVEAFKVANMGALLASSVFIVLAVVPDLAGHLDDGRVRHRPPAHPRRPVLLILFVFGLTLPFEGHHHAALLPCPADGDPQHAAGHRPAAHRPVHAVRCVLDAGPFRQHAERDLGGGEGRRRRPPGTSSGGSTCRSPARRSRRSGS